MQIVGQHTSDDADRPDLIVDVILNRWQCLGTEALFAFLVGARELFDILHAVLHVTEQLSDKGRLENGSTTGRMSQAIVVVVVAVGAPTPLWGGVKTGRMSPAIVVVVVVVGAPTPLWGVVITGRKSPASVVVPLWGDVSIIVVGGPDKIHIVGVLWR